MRHLVNSIGEGWNAFWFTPRSGWQLVPMRHLVGLAALLWLVSLSPILEDLFATSGWLTSDLVQRLATEGDLTRPSPGFSYLFLVHSTPWLWVTHIVSLAVMILVMLGVAPRWSTPLALVVALSYVHRAPMMATSFEFLLCWLLLYLCLAPPQRLFKRQLPPLTWTANLGLRLIQVHLCGVYMMMSFLKLGSAAWVRGEAAWYLMVNQQVAMDLSALAASTYFVNAVTHLWLGTELLFPVLVWVRPLRPLVLPLAAAVWVGRAVLTGQVAFSGLMLIGGLAFVTARADTGDRQH